VRQSALATKGRCHLVAVTVRASGSRGGGWQRSSSRPASAMSAGRSGLCAKPDRNKTKGTGATRPIFFPPPYCLPFSASLPSFLPFPSSARERARSHSRPQQSRDTLSATQRQIHRRKEGNGTKCLSARSQYDQHFQVARGDRAEPSRPSRCLIWSRCRRRQGARALGSYRLCLPGLTRSSSTACSIP
jgi:hypothetical protein